MLRPSIEAAGLDPDDLPAHGAIDIGKDIDIGARENRPSAGAISGARGTDLGGERCSFRRRNYRADIAEYHAADLRFL